MDAGWNSTSDEVEANCSRLSVLIYVLIPRRTNVLGRLKPLCLGEPVTLFKGLQYSDSGYATLFWQAVAVTLYVVAWGKEYAQHVGSVNKFCMCPKNDVENGVNLGFKWSGGGRFRRP